MTYLLNDNPYLRERDELLAHLVDDGTLSAEQARRERWRERGICSAPDCEQAIDGWCEECGAKLCADCLMAHEARHYDESDMAQEDYDECWPEGESAEASGGDGQ